MRGTLMVAPRELPWGRRIPHNIVPSGTVYTLDSSRRVLANEEDVDSLLALGMRLVGVGGTRSSGEAAATTAAAATVTEFRSAAPDKTVTPSIARDAMDWVNLDDAATIAVDHSAGVNRRVTLAGNRTFGNPTNVKVGWPLNILVVQDATGSRTASWGSSYKFGDAGAPTLSTDPGAEDLLTFTAVSDTKFAFLGIRKGIQ